MVRLVTFVLILGLASAACAIPSTMPPEVATSVPLPTQPSAVPPEVAIAAPEGWSFYRNEELGFGFAYPAAGALTSGEGQTLATIAFPVDPSTNVVEEAVSLSVTGVSQPCASPLGEGFAPEELAPEDVERNGIPFLRQTRSGVAAGTSSTWVAYSTARDGSCVSLGYVLRTFDPANLDPTRFPTPPATVDWQGKVQDFEAMVATFTWFR